jgi:hypothetical protein
VRELQVSEQTYYRWCNQFGGLKADDAKQLKDLETATQSAPPAKPPSTAATPATDPASTATATAWPASKCALRPVAPLSYLMQ